MALPQLHARILPSFLGIICASSPSLTARADSSGFPAFSQSTTPNLGRICAPSKRLWARCFSMMQRGSRRYASRAKCSPFIIQYMRGHGPSPLHARILPAFRPFVCSTLNLGRVCAPSPFLTPSADSSRFPAFSQSATPNLGRICAPSSSPTARADSSCFLAFSLS